MKRREGGRQRDRERQRERERERERERKREKGEIFENESYLFSLVFAFCLGTNIYHDENVIVFCVKTY